MDAARMNRRALALAFALSAVVSLPSRAAQPADRARIRMDSIVREVVLSVGGKKDPPVRRRFDAVVLENRYLQVLVCPSLGERIVNVVDRLTGRRCLFEGTINYSGNAYDEGGGSGGGLQINHPLYHAGSSYVAALPYATEVAADGTAALTLAYTSYPHLQQTVWRISLRPDEAAFRTAYRFENLAPFSMGFNPWIDASFASSEDIQFTLPAEWVAGHWFGIAPRSADGANGHNLMPWPIGSDGADLSYLKNRRKDSAYSYFSYGLSGGYSGIYYHDSNVGFASVFDPQKMPAAKAYGAPAPLWCEVWSAFAHNMEDPRWLAPHESVEATDLWFPLHGIRGLTWANDNGALNLRKAGDRLSCGVYVLRDRGDGALRVVADGTPVLQARLALRPEQPFFRTVACPPDIDEVRAMVLDAAGRVLIERQEFFGPRPRREYALPEKPWHLRTPVTEARWQEAFTPLMGWGPWYHPPTAYARALTADPADVEARIGRARSLIKEARANLFRGRPQDVTPESEYEQAAAILTKLAEDRPADPRAIQLLGLVEFQTGRLDEAGRTLSRLAGTPDDSAIVHYHLGLLAARRGTWPQAAEEARAALALAPDSTLSRLLAAIALLRTGGSGEARAVLAPVIEANPAGIGALVLVRRAAEAAGRAEEVERLSAELARLERLGPVQARAAAGAIAALESGRDLDPRAVDTTVGPQALPGREP